MRFIATYSRHTERSFSLGTLKVALLYGHGTMIKCLDHSPGGRSTFERIVWGFFESLIFKDLEGAPTVYADGFRLREGNGTAGFRYNSLMQRPDDAGYSERYVSFVLATDGKKWATIDFGYEVMRNSQGNLETLRQLTWIDGQGPMVLTAKPAEGGKYRLKMELGVKSSAIDLTAKAPLTTRLWAAADMAKLSAGTLPSLRFAVLDVVDGDPSFQYMNLTRSKAGVLLQDVDEGPQAKKTGQTGATREELSVDDNGLVTKWVSTELVGERVYNAGHLPSAMLRAGGAKKVGAASVNSKSTAKPPADPSKGDAGRR